MVCTESIEQKQEKQIVKPHKFHFQSHYIGEFSNISNLRKSINWNIWLHVCV